MPDVASLLLAAGLEAQHGFSAPRSMSLAMKIFFPDDACHKVVEFDSAVFD